MLLNPLPLQLLIVSLVTTFQTLSPNTEQAASTEEMCCIALAKKEKKADTNVGNVPTSQDFVQELASKFTTLNETEH